MKGSLFICLVNLVSQSGWKDDKHHPGQAGARAPPTPTWIAPPKKHHILSFSLSQMHFLKMYYLSFTALLIALFCVC